MKVALRHSRRLLACGSRLALSGSFFCMGGRKKDKKARKADIHMSRGGEVASSTGFEPVLSG